MAGRAAGPAFAIARGSREQIATARCVWSALLIGARRPVVARESSGSAPCCLSSRGSGIWQG